MSNSEQNQINQLPDCYKPLSAWQYFGYTILFALPIIGFIMLIVKALSNENINLRNYARSYFCIYVIVLVIFLVTLVAGFAGGAVNSLSQLQA